MGLIRSAAFNIAYKFCWALLEVVRTSPDTFFTPELARLNKYYPIAMRRGRKSKPLSTK